MDNPGSSHLSNRMVSTTVWWILPSLITWMVLRGPGPDFSRILDALPQSIAAFLYWFPATTLSMCALGIFVLRCRRDDRLMRRTSLPTLFLPTYLTGLESTNLLSWSLRCTPGVAQSAGAKLVWGAWLNATALGVAIVVCAIAARLCGHRSTLPLPMPPVVFAIVANAALPWPLIFYLMSTPG